LPNDPPEGPAPLSAAIPVEKLGPPGLTEELVISAGSSEEDLGPEPRTKTMRIFEAWATLVASPPLTTPQLSTSPLMGDTPLAAQSPGLDFLHTFGVLGGHDGRKVHLMFEQNDKGRVGLVRARLLADSYHDARDTFRSALNRLLSIWCWESGVPLSTAHTCVSDPTNGLQYLESTTPYKPVDLLVNQGSANSVAREFQAAFSFFREGLSSTSPPYRLLCFYKTLGVLRRTESSFAKAIADSGGDRRVFHQEATCKIQADDLAALQWPETIGWSIGKFHEKTLRPLRNKIAHDLLDDDDDYALQDDPGFHLVTRSSADCLPPLIRRYGYAISRAYQSSRASGAKDLS
jgi:hypothetical protein